MAAGPGVGFAAHGGHGGHHHGGGGGGHHGGHPHGHHGGGRPGFRRWSGYGPPGWGWGYDYWPADVYYVGETYSVDAVNAGRAELLGQGVSWSAAMIGAQVYMQNNPPLPGGFVRIVAGDGQPACTWVAAAQGWQMQFCTGGDGFYGVGSDPELPPPKGSYAALAVLGVISVGALAWMWFGASRGSRYGFPDR